MNCLNMPTSPSKVKGQIQVKLPPNYCIYITELMRRVRRYQIAQHVCLVIKYAKDVRYSNEDVATHDKFTMPAIAVTMLSEVYQEALQCSVIGIDEGQFFPDCVDFSEEMANQGRTVIVAALDGTFQRKAFGNILNLVPLAESVVKLNAVCMGCYREASYTTRLGSEKQVEVIGGTDIYRATCRRCYFGESEPLQRKTEKENLGRKDETSLHLKHFDNQKVSKTPRRALENLCLN
uniref:Thymidine kinase n=1 Tax=Callorhinchus milii TaxID=7868 RepID=A0A4W3KIW3_CALMI